MTERKRRLRLAGYDICIKTSWFTEAVGIIFCIKTLNGSGVLLENYVKYPCIFEQAGFIFLYKAVL